MYKRQEYRITVAFIENTGCSFVVRRRSACYAGGIDEKRQMCIRDRVYSLLPVKDFVSSCVVYFFPFVTIFMAMTMFPTGGTINE